MDENCNTLLSEFRRLGGIIENVCQQEGESSILVEKILLIESFHINSFTMLTIEKSKK